MFVSKALLPEGVAKTAGMVIDDGKNLPMCRIWRMEISPSLAEATEVAQGFARVPVWFVIPETPRDPLEAILALKNLSHHAYIL